jgi:LuxR family maltose regulon positive regulatory protein
VHLIIATRADPPLSRLRVRGELVEIRAADLRFTPDEAAAYLNGTMGLDLTGADVAVWMDGRKAGSPRSSLPRLSLQGRPDPASFIAKFAGDDRYVVDYLADEVLARQPEDVRSFLLRTSILDRLTAPLCDAVTGRPDSRAVLERLDRGNVFLVALDDRRPGTATTSSSPTPSGPRLLDEDPDSAPVLHRRASDWFERQGDRAESIRHAVDGGDHARAAELIEKGWRMSAIERAEMTMRRWLEALPPAIFNAGRCSPRPSLVC